jgi:hypothetical protein
MKEFLRLLNVVSEEDSLVSDDQPSTLLHMALRALKTVNLIACYAANKQNERSSVLLDWLRDCLPKLVNDYILIDYDHANNYIPPLHNTFAS